MRRKLIAGNWKMNTTLHSGTALARDVLAGVSQAMDKVDVLICPPFPYLIPVVEAVRGSKLAVGAQNAYFENPGAFTGETALEMLLDVGCKSVILGHSERRHVLGENDKLINKKVLAARKHKLQAILCVGELLAERENGKTKHVLDTQLAGGLAEVTEEMLQDVVIAYEPVWAIGTGQTATPDQAESAHAHIRRWLETRFSKQVAAQTRILYGGSVKASNAEALLSKPNLDGALVGGASLKPEEFLPIVEAGVKTSG